MAYSEAATQISATAGATFSSADLYKWVVWASSQDRTVVLPNTTGNIVPIGVLYGRTSTTSAAGTQAVPIAISGVVKLRMAASTLAAGQYVASSTAGLGIAPTTDAYVAGLIVAGSSGAANRVVTVQLHAFGTLGAP